MFYSQYYDVNPSRVVAIEFDVWSTEKIRKLSVAEITTFVTFDKLGYPIAGGLHDARLGPLKQHGDPCHTCGEFQMKCVGHFGHIELPLPVFNPMFTAIVTNFLKISCISCFQAVIPTPNKIVLTTQLKLVDLGCLVEARELDTYLELEEGKSTEEIRDEMQQLYNRLAQSHAAATPCKNSDDLWRHYLGRLFRRGALKTCPHCQKPHIKVTFQNGRFYTSCRLRKLQKTVLVPSKVQILMRKLWMREKELLCTLIKPLSSATDVNPTDLCFTMAVTVTPSNTRPMQMIRGRPVEHPKNFMFRQILQDCMQVRDIMQVMAAENKGNPRNNDSDEDSSDGERQARQSLVAQPVSSDTRDLVAMYKGDTVNEKLHNAWYALQMSVNALVDSNAMRNLMNMSVGVARVGVKQLIEKKAGLMRKNMMGKRADFYARSVLTPDPLISINEIGVPEVFAKKLTFPVPVTPWNVSELRKFVLNGPGKYPGANVVESDDGSLVWISESNAETRRGLAKTLLTPNVDSRGPKVVHRHLQDGDMLLMNRQPTLHRPSVMAHKARILEKGKTFRLHYANCKAYNADFDGDEMNAHFPQNEVARAEASEIMNACHQYLVPRDGTPLSGLIQDHVISAFRMTVRGRFFERRQYHQLVYQALGAFVDDIRLLPPTILKPERLWSGKQVISTIVVNLTPKGYTPLNLFSKTKLGFNAWPTTGAPCAYMTDKERKFMSETNVVLWRGQLLCGVVDKNHVGATHFGLVHSFYELYGGQHSANLLSALSKVLTAYLQENAFSLGVKDIVVKRKPDRQRRKLSRMLEAAGIQAAKNALGVAEDEEIDAETLEKRLEVAYKKNTNFRALLDHEYKMVLDPVTNEINKVCLPEGLVEPFPANNLQLMVQSGAKGSTVNTMQISCLLGQIELEGKRPRLMISGKSLPCFRPYDTAPIAGGFIVSRFMSGLRPQEFFFHCMAGREGLIDTAVKTSRSGYLQRCLIKHLEGLVVNYDLTVRDSDNSVIQWRYGEDGLDIPKSQLLKPDQMSFFADNIETLYDEENFAPLKEGTAKQELRAQKRSIAAWKSSVESGDVLPCRQSGFLKFCQEMASEPNPPQIEDEVDVPGRLPSATALCTLWYSMHKETREKYAKNCFRVPDPVISNFAPDVHFGSVSENVDKMLQNYFEEKHDNLPVKKAKFRDAVHWKSFKSLCQPGEAVGVLAAQSVGEPSTQMTLNTFHFAGRGEMNVTLGIPRLREILMVATRKIKTPCTEIPFRTDVPRLEKRAERLRRSLTRMVMKDVLEKITVKEMFVPKRKVYKYQIRLHYLPRKSYSSNTNIKPQHIIKCAETRFCWRLEQMLKKHLTNVYSIVAKVQGDRTIAAVDDEDDNFDEFAGDNASGEAKNDDENSDAEGDGDATEAKSKRHEGDDNEYDDDEEEEDDEDDHEFEVTANYAAENENEDADKDADANETAPAVNAASTSSKPKLDDSVVQRDYGIGNVKHDEESKSWTTIELWTSSKFKRLDLSSLLPKEVENVVIHEVPGIKRAITYVNNDGLLTLKTEGSYGISELFKHDRLLNLNKLYSNDIHAVADNYGIEAANRVLIREVQDVFKVYGITVDPRHLTLVADYMTFDGTYKALNRGGMDNCPSTLQQMSFETTLKYLKNAAVRKLKDNLQSPSSSVFMGQESKIGSGLIRLYCK